MNNDLASVNIHQDGEDGLNIADEGIIVGIIAGALNLTSCEVAGAMVEIYDTAVEVTLVNCTLITGTTEYLLEIVCGEHGAVSSLTFIYVTSLLCAIVFKFDVPHRPLSGSKCRDAFLLRRPEKCLCDGGAESFR
mmetsp:Transcript_20788/g.51207  ORF Transcript_20788/g.51207 Transcript_20788/m.51207 type:complete len:135 (+) Transcript_20788:1286-1690(+)